MNPRRLHSPTTLSMRSEGPVGVSPPVCASTVSSGSGIGGNGTGWHPALHPDRQPGGHRIGQEATPDSEHRPPVDAFDQTVQILVVGKSAGRHPGRGPQAEGQCLELALPVGQDLLARGSGPPLVDHPHVPVRGPYVPPSAGGPVRVGRRSDAPVLALVPVEAIVPAPVPGPGPVGDLLPPVPGAAEDPVSYTHLTLPTKRIV